MTRENFDRVTYRFAWNRWTDALHHLRIERRFLFRIVSSLSMAMPRLHVSQTDGTFFAADMLTNVFVRNFAVAEHAINYAHLMKKWEKSKIVEMIDKFGSVPAFWNFLQISLHVFRFGKLSGNFLIRICEVYIYIRLKL